MKVLSFAVFVVLQILFLPLAIVGSAIVGCRQIVVSKRLGVSQTGIEVLNGRWTMHIFGIREDPATARLAGALSNTSTLGLRLALFPLWVKYKLSGTHFVYPRVPEEGAEAVADLVIARTVYFDRIISRVLGDMDQFVVLGGEYDTRAYGELGRKGLAFFEMDQANTQKLKIAALREADVDAGHVTFVEVNFSHHELFEKLAAAGYDRGKKTLFLWEGVTLYLSEEGVRKTLRDVREHAAPGSVMVADFYGERLIEFGAKGMNKRLLAYSGEALDFGLPFEVEPERELHSFLESEGVSQGETCFLGKISDKGPFAVVVECRL